MSETAVVPSQQKQVVFYEAEITAVLINGDVYASVRHMCQVLGLDVQAQTRRIERNDVLSDGQRVATVATHQRGNQATYVLRADLVPMWLVGVDTRRMDEDKKQRLIDFQKRAAKLLWEAFQRGELTDPLDIDQLAAAGNEVAKAYQIGQAIMSLARHQLQLQQRVNEHDRRLEALETAVSSPDRKISDAQAMEISQAVKAVAMLLSKQTKRNEFGGVYGEVYRRYNITSYKQLPLSQFDDCMKWLNDWRENLESQSF
ncbi:MAG: ORF6C domain-containing protein [Anaerolineales bacterium]|nr:ORF6C domain-containing protein [Anaerolineales bacterium]